MTLELVEGIAFSRQRVFLESGHYPFVEEADAFHDAIGNFIKGLA
jgi:hypothetical protein